MLLSLPHRLICFGKMGSLALSPGNSAGYLTHVDIDSVRSAVILSVIFLPGLGAIVKQNGAAEA